MGISITGTATASRIWPALAAGILCASSACAAPAPGAYPSATQFMTRQSGRIAYDDSGGHGPMVLCVPGLGDLRRQYRFLAPALIKSGIRVVTMDLRGMGESSTGWPDYSRAAIGSDMVALLTHLGAPHAYVVANSYAAASAVWAAAQRPDLVAGIVLIGPFVRDHPASLATRTLLHVALLWPWGPSMWSMYYGSLYKTAPPADLAEYRARLVANLREPGRMDALRAMIWSPMTEAESPIVQVHVPALVVMGSNDPDFDDPEGEAKWIAEHLHATLLIAPGAGHYPHVEMPDLVAGAIVRMIRGNSDGR